MIVAAWPHTIEHNGDEADRDAECGPMRIGS